MAHHKRNKPKSRRAGCLCCKPWKHQRSKGQHDSRTIQDRRHDQREEAPARHGVW